MEQALKLLDVYRRKKLSYYRWRTQATLLAKITLALCLACLTGLLAQIKVYLPWTPVPIVATQLGVILAAVLSGRRWGGISMLFYALGGAAGIPWFAGFQGGLTALAGPTGGYILGFILAALFMGNLFDRVLESRRFVPLTAAILFAQLVLVYIPGLIHLSLWLKFVSGQAITLSSVLWMGYIPFLAGDVLKSFIGAGVAKALVSMDKY
ncbi:MAG TPA: biotin transporter BioY [Peptococcaceae bacterium]|nr:biotin transporter BioY [Peptococcaceae bacterium]